MDLLTSRCEHFPRGHLLPGVMLPFAHRQCIHTEIQKSTCIIFCISCYMYHMYHMYESVAMMAQTFIMMPHRESENGNDELTDSQLYDACMQVESMSASHSSNVLSVAQLRAIAVLQLASQAPRGPPCSRLHKTKEFMFYCSQWVRRSFSTEPPARVQSAMLDHSLRNFLLAFLEVATR